MYFSRRKVAAPSPPLPACTSILASSMNFMLCKQKSPIGDDRALAGVGYRLRRSLFCYDAHGVVAVRAAHRVVHLTRDARIERVVAADADVGAGMHARAALAHEDLSGVDALAAVDLHAETLRLGIAPVARATTCFLVCHC